ncbi:rhamnulose-1-phosphate aldolase [candidate division KSB1 bacterium]|nr:rhamnulose-1-phosphate aldolase [candidate division KSB1 bacterium]
MNDILKSSQGLRTVIFDVSKIGDFLWKAGWAERNAGNITVRVDEFVDQEPRDLADYPLFTLNEFYPELNDAYFLVTGTGKRMRDLARDPLKNAALIKIISAGSEYRIICENQQGVCDFRPTSELPTHLAIHRLIAKRKSEEKIIIHTHPTELIAMTQIAELSDEHKFNSLLYGMHPETILVIPDGVGLVKYETPGTQHIALQTVDKFKDHAVVVWEKHGCFAIGRDLEETFDLIDVLVKSAKIFFQVKSAGYHPEGLRTEQLLDLKRAYGID